MRVPRTHLLQHVGGEHDERQHAHARLVLPTEDDPRLRLARVRVPVCHLARRFFLARIHRKSPAFSGAFYSGEFKPPSRPHPGYKGPRSEMGQPKDLAVRMAFVQIHTAHFGVIQTFGCDLRKTFSKSRRLVACGVRVPRCKGGRGAARRSAPRQCARQTLPGDPDEQWLPPPVMRRMRLRRQRAM